MFSKTQHETKIYHPGNLSSSWFLFHQDFLRYLSNKLLPHTGMKEPYLEPLLSWDSLFTKLQEKRGYRYQVLIVHQVSPNLLEQETKRETRKRVLYLWNFSKIKEKKTETQLLLQPISSQTLFRTMTSSVYVLCDRWHVRIYVSCLLFLLLTWSTNPKIRPITVQRFRCNQKFRIKLR